MATSTATRPDAALAAEVGHDPTASLDQLLLDSTGGGLRRWAPGLAGLRAAATLAAHPATLAPPHGRLRQGDGARRRRGARTSRRTPKDARFADDAWSGNPVLRRVVQSYLVGSSALEQLLDDANLPWRDDRRLRFLVTNLVAAAAPSNVPWLNPTALKKGLDTGGRTYAAGAWQLRSAPRVPQMVDSDAFMSLTTLGEDLAVSEGAVVLRTELFELIQYAPRACSRRSRRSRRSVARSEQSTFATIPAARGSCPTRRSHRAMTDSDASPARNPGTSSTGRPSPRGTSTPAEDRVHEQAQQLGLPADLGDGSAPPAAVRREAGGPRRGGVQGGVVDLVGQEVCQRVAGPGVRAAASRAGAARLPVARLPVAVRTAGHAGTVRAGVERPPGPEAARS